MFIAASFTLAKRWKQTQCPSTDEWIRNVVYTYSGLFFIFKKEGNADACYNMDEPGGHYAE